MATSQNVLRIYRGTSSWMCVYQGSWGEPVESLFGTAHLPLPFTLRAQVADVLDRTLESDAGRDADVVVIEP